MWNINFSLIAFEFSRTFSVAGMSWFFVSYMPRRLPNFIAYGMFLMAASSVLLVRKTSRVNSL